MSDNEFSDEELVDVECEFCHEMLSIEPTAYGIEIEFVCPFCDCTNQVVIHEND